MTKRHPSGLPYIILNEAAERFSFYGMKCILVIFMTTHLALSDGTPDLMSEPEALAWYHLFGTANYLFPIVGALIADTLLGKYRTIVYLSIVYCLGHAVLAFDATRFGLMVGLALIAIGAGGIKPCVSAHLGDQYSPSQQGLLSKAYGWFYLSINIGAFVSTLLVPYLLENYGAHVAFGVPGVLMGAATLAFIAGRKKFITITPVPFGLYIRSLREEKHRGQLFAALVLFTLLSAFWSLFDQTGSSWVVQANQLDRIVTLPLLGTFEILPSQIQTLNPLFILLFVPLFSHCIYPALEKVVTLTAERKIWIGVGIAALSFVFTGVTQLAIDRGIAPSIGWQALAFAVLTAAEVMVSVTALEYAYVRAPSIGRSFVMSFYMLSVALGNFFTAATSGALAWLYDGEAVVSGGYFFSYAALAAVASGAIFYLFDWRHSYGSTEGTGHRSV